MGAAQSCQLLPSAEEVLTQRDTPYDLKVLSAPRVTGFALRAFIWILEGPLYGTIMRKLMRNSGIPQVLSGVAVPEAPTFVPQLPHPTQQAPGTLIFQAAQSPASRVAAAAKAVPNFTSNNHQKIDSQKRRARIADYHQAYMSGAITPDQVAARLIECVAASEALTPPMRFFIAHDPQHIRQQAAASTQRYKEGTPLSVLDGVPFAVKDLYDAVPYPTSCGTSWMASQRKVEGNAAMVEALLAAGAVLVGKANTVEVGLGTTGLNVLHGTPRNPHAAHRYTGGSSSGSAAIVASGLCPICIGSDGGGSIRIPASLCGVVGLKPTYGRDKTAMPNIDYSVSLKGVIAGSVEDALIMYAATANAGLVEAAGPGALGPPAVSIPRTLHTSADDGLALKGMKAGVYWKWFEHADAEVVEACRRSLMVLEACGCEVVDVVIPELEFMRVAHTATITSEMLTSLMAQAHDKRLRHQFNLDVQASMLSAMAFTSTDYVQAQKIRTRMTKYHLHILRDVTFIASPATPITAPPIDPKAVESGESNLTLVSTLMRFILAANFVGLPALSVPVGHDSQGLPIGLQLLGRPWDEATLLLAASVVEVGAADQQKPPKILYNPLHVDEATPAPHKCHKMALR